MSRSRVMYNLIMWLWPWGKVLNGLATVPLFGHLLQPCFGSEDNEAIIIPVLETVRGTESVVLPTELLTPLIKRASARVILGECLCRRGEACLSHSHQVGCLFLGEGATRINPAMGRTAAVDEALYHAQRAIESGLIPLIAHSAFDAWVLGIPYRRTLAICFCCECCCSIRQGLRLGPPTFWDTVVRVPGLAMYVGPACTGCGQCADVCPIGAVSVEHGKAHVAALCKGCGRCATLCPVGAISLHLDEDADPLGQLQARIERRTSIWSPEEQVDSAGRAA
jgi:UDP-glucose 4-epimerase